MGVERRVENDKGLRGVHAAWAAGFALLGTLGLFCWLLLAPFLQVRAAVMAVYAARSVGGLTLPHTCTLASATREKEEIITRLGGPGRAEWKLRIYAQAPELVAPLRSQVPRMLTICKMMQKRAGS